MPRCHGSYIGHVPEPTASATSGIWKACDAQELLLDGKWPSQPSVPGAPTGTPGNEQVVLTWPALTASPSVTDYGIQYSADAGATWTTFTDSVSSATTATVTGLTNGTAYLFRLYGINVLGDGPYGSSSASVTPTDATMTPSLLMHFNGANGSTTFTDSSQNSISFTAHGGAVISTAQSKFGGASGYFGPDSYLDTSFSGGVIDFDGGAGTVEAWLYLTEGVPAANFGSLASPAAMENYSGLSFGLFATANMGASYINTAPAEGPSMSLNEWHHVAWVIASDGVTMRYYLDGVLGGTVTLSGQQDQAGIIVGNFLPEGLDGFTGYVDELRVVKGAALYTANFTPPAAPY